MDHAARHNNVPVRTDRGDLCLRVPSKAVTHGSVRRELNSLERYRLCRVDDQTFLALNRRVFHLSGHTALNSARATGTRLASVVLPINCIFPVHEIVNTVGSRGAPFARPGVLLVRRF